MLTKRQIAAMVIARFTGGLNSRTKKIDERDVFAYIDAALSQVIGNEVKTSGAINSDWTKSFTVNVQYYALRKESYFTLPSTLVSMPQSRGLRQVSFTEGQETPFIIQENGARGVYADLECSFVGDNYVCYLEGDRVFIPELKRGKYKLLVKMICGTSGYDKNEPMQIPSNMEGTLIDTICKLMQGQASTIHKLTNDSNPNT